MRGEMNAQVSVPVVADALAILSTRTHRSLYLTTRTMVLIVVVIELLGGAMVPSVTALLGVGQRWWSGLADRVQTKALVTVTTALESTVKIRTMEEPCT